MDEAQVQISCPKVCPITVGNAVFKSITDFELSEKDMERARAELGETDEKKRLCLQKLKEKLSQDENVRYRTDDLYLLRFLRVRKFDCDKAYKYLKHFYYLRNHKPEFFNIPQNLQHVLDTKMFTVLPYTSENGLATMWLDFGNWKPEEIPFEEVVGSLFCMHDIIYMNLKFQVNGVMGIWDTSGLTGSHLSQVLKHNRLYTFFNLIQYCYPLRANKVFVVNTGSLTRLLYNIIRPMLSQKIRDRVFFLGSDLSILHEHINPAILPKKLGGQLEDEDCRVTQLVLENIPYIKYERSFH